MSEQVQADWARALTDEGEFGREQTALGHCWTLLCVAPDLKNDGDWVRASLGGRSVFLQRFGDSIRGFENRCAHRFFPVRTADKGNGPIVCGFHHWRYDRDGRAVGIPMCQELFKMTPRELGAKLNPIDIATCGSFIFGRFPLEQNCESIEQFLGESFPILDAMSRFEIAPKFFTCSVRANWRLCYHISLEDYHTVAVHPSTFGKIGYLKRDNIGYFRFGRHSAYFTNSDPEALSKMAAACRQGTWSSANYRVFHIFPNLAVSHFHSDGKYWYVMVLQYVPETQNRSTMRAWIYPAPFPVKLTAFQRLIRPLAELIRGTAVSYYAKKVLREDNDVCEQLQTVANQIDALPILGALEERIAWFEEAYSQTVMVKEAS